jgi:cytochrome bd-type quinol oxidase subunit 2
MPELRGILLSGHQIDKSELAGIFAGLLATLTLALLIVVHAKEGLSYLSESQDRTDAFRTGGWHLFITAIAVVFASGALMALRDGIEVEFFKTIVRHTFPLHMLPSL